MGAVSKPDAKGAKAIGRNAISVIDGSRKLGASDLSKLKGKFSASCMAGYIFNKPKGQEVQVSTDHFLTGIIKQTGKIEGGLAAGALGAYVGGMVVTAVIGTAGLPILVIAGVAAVGITLSYGYVGGVAGASIAEYSYDKIKSIF